MIGGPGIEVQIDKSTFGKRKYNRGQLINTKFNVWLVVAAYKTTGYFLDSSCFSSLCVVPGVIL